MLIDISESDKIRVGLAIDLRRKEHFKKTGDKSFKIINFINGICSRETYNRISKGLLVKESDHYDQLLQKIHRKYNYEELYRERCMKLETQLLYELRMDDTVRFFRTLTVIINELAAYKEFILEDILYENMCIILKFKNGNRISSEEFSFLLRTFPMLNNQEKEIVGNFVLHYVYQYQAMKETYEVMKKS